MTSLFASLRIWADMVKLSHSVFALPFALMSAFLAGRHLEGHGRPYWGQLGLIVACMVAGRSVAMTFNRIVDAEIDARNPRTAQRPIPSGRLGRLASFVMLVLSAGTFGAACLGFHFAYGSDWPILLSGPVLVFLCGYSYTKRFTKWSHFYLGLALALSPAAAWLAVHPGSFGASTVVLMVAVTCWVGGFDVIYSCQDIEIDRRDGLFSLPSRIGPARALWMARTAHGFTVIQLVLLGVLERLGVVYAGGVVGVAVLLFAEHRLVKPDDYRRVNVAFFTLNGLVSLVLAGASIADIILRPRIAAG